MRTMHIDASKIKKPINVKKIEKSVTIIEKSVIKNISEDFANIATMQTVLIFRNAKKYRKYEHHVEVQAPKMLVHIFGTLI